jgi:hypothetical protein
MKVFLTILAVKFWLKGVILPWSAIPNAPPFAAAAVTVLLVNVQLVTFITPWLPAKLLWK